MRRLLVTNRLILQIGLPTAFMLAVLVLAAPYLNPYIGSGSFLSKDNFILYRLFGITREQTFIGLSSFVFDWLPWIVVIFLGCRAGPLYGLFQKPGEVVTRQDQVDSIALAVFFLALFLVFLTKNHEVFVRQIDGHWFRAFFKYDLDWGTPAFSLAGNLLYHFGIQPPLNTNLSPFVGLAHVVSPRHEIPISVSLMYIALGSLLWFVGGAMGLPLISRTLMAGTAALICTIPFGLESLIPLLPPYLLVSQAILSHYWEEVGILTLTSAFLFFWLGQSGKSSMNLAWAIGFAVVSADLLLAFPYIAIFYLPVVFFYCLAFLLTAQTAREFWWKVSTSGALALAMLLTNIPLFFLNLYSYCYGKYFSQIVRHAEPIVLLKGSTMAAAFAYDFRVPLLLLVSFGTMVFLLTAANRPLRRIIIAALSCELGIISMGAANALFFRFPVSFFYSEEIHSPLLVSFFVLFLMAACVTFVKYMRNAMQFPPFERVRRAITGVAFKHRFILYVVALLGVLTYVLLRLPQQSGYTDITLSKYPPDEPPSVKILESEVGLKLGGPFRGRVLIVVAQDVDTRGFTVEGILTVIFQVLENHYGRYLGNDHWFDLPAFDIPVANEYSQWTSPITFTVLRTFFGRKEDAVDKTLFFLREYNERVAKMLGIRMVVTDASKISGGTIVYESMAGDVPLRIFQIDGVNVGQYSPTRAERISTASEAITAISRNSFDPEHDVLVEEQLPSDLVPGRLLSLTTELGPTLSVQGESSGRSLLVLPFEYSHCLRLDNEDGTSARLLPVNLQQIGLLFDRSVRAKISYHFGPLDQPHCRGDDVKRADRLHLHEAQ